MVTVLKIRALFEDYGNGALLDEKLVEAIDLIEEAENYVSQKTVKPSKKEIKKARKSGDKELLKTAKANYKKQKADNEKIEIAQYVSKEIHKFESPVVKMQVERAKKVYDSGINGLYTLNTISLKDAKSLVKNSDMEKETRLAMIEIARQEKRSKKLLSRYYQNGIEEFDTSVFDSLVSEISTLEAKSAELIDEIKQKKNRKQNERKLKKSFHKSREKLLTQSVL